MAQKTASDQAMVCFLFVKNRTGSSWGRVNYTIDEVQTVGLDQNFKTNTNVTILILQREI